MELDNAADERAFPSLKLMQRKKEEDAANTELKMQAQFESVIQSVEERKHHLRQTMERMEKCKGDFKEWLKIKDVNKQLAVSQAKHDKQRTHEQQEYLFDLREETEELVKLKEHLQKRVWKYELYHHFMDRVVLASKHDPVHLLSRFNTLKMARENLRLTIQQYQESTRKARSHLAILTKESSDAIMQLKSRVARLQRVLDTAHQNRLYWEITWAHIQKTAAEKTMLFGQIRLATLNLYRNVCRKSRFCQAFPVHPEDSSGQLEKIEIFITEWTSALKLNAGNTSEEEHGIISSYTHGTLV